MQFKIFPGCGAIIAFFALTLFSCETAPPSYRSADVIPCSYRAPAARDDGWKPGLIDESVLSVAALEEGIGAIRSGEYPGVHSVLIAHQGRLVLEEYFSGYFREGVWTDFNAGTIHSLQCVSKSIVALVVGIAIDRGDIPGTGASVLSWYPEYNLKDRDEKSAITLRDLLTNQSGFRWNEWDVSYWSRLNDLNRFYRSKDPLEYLLKKKLADAPGTRFYYNTAAVTLIGDLCYRSTGYRFDQYARTHLFEPLGIEDVFWETTRNGMISAGAGLWLTPRDLLKIGQLVLQRGQWQGKQVVSVRWLEEALTPFASFEEGIDYGYLWWLPNQTDDATQITFHPYVAGGTGGQWLLVYPQQQLVVVTTGGNYFEEDACYLWLDEYFLKALAAAAY